MKRLVMVGAGHAHALALQAFAQNGIMGVEIVVVSTEAMAPYSGMIPGWLAGVYEWDGCCIDFAYLCRRAGAQLLLDEVVTLDPSRSELRLRSGLRISYDVLSLNIGSTLFPPQGEGVALLPMRPLSALRMQWESLINHVSLLDNDDEFRIVMVGGGVAGVESVLAAQHRLVALAPDANLTFKLAIQGEAILPGMAAGSARRLTNTLKRRGIEVVNRFQADHMAQNAVVSSDWRTLPADVVMWATGAQAHQWPKEAGLSVDDKGFILVDAALRSRSHPNIYAAGDCVGWKPPLPKAGVYAVRMGPILAHNLLAAIKNLPLQKYLPQRRNLALIGSADGSAVADWGAFSWQGDWIWRIKQFIDRRFVARCNAT